MKTYVDVDLVNFEVPSFVKTENSDAKEGYTAFHLRDLRVETLNELCDQFRRDVFKKAKKELPVG